MLSAHGTVTIRPKEVIPVYREEWDATVTDYKYNLVNRDFVSRGGSLYQVKVQKPDEFIPAGIDPDNDSRQNVPQRPVLGDFQQALPFRDQFPRYR